MGMHGKGDSGVRESPARDFTLYAFPTWKKEEGTGNYLWPGSWKEREGSRLKRLGKQIFLLGRGR